MRSFDDILAIAIARKGSREAVLGDLDPSLSADALAAIANPVWLAAIARAVFQAGISWQVVENRWEGITAAFGGFEIGPLAQMDEDAFDDLMDDTRIIRSGPKIAAIRDNAAFIDRVDREEGGFARKIADWPAEDFAGLLIWLAKEGARLDGVTGASVLLALGKDGFALSPDVVARLEEEGVIAGPPTSARAIRAVGAAFNTWAAQSGLPLKAVAQVLARSVDEAA